MPFKKIRIQIFLIAVIFSNFSYSQNSYFEIGGGLGLSNYSGDLSPSSIGQILGTSRFSSTAYLRYNLSPYINLKLSGTYAGLEAKDSRSNNVGIRNRNLSFYTDLYEIGLIGEINIFKYNPLDGESNFTVYLMGGISGFHFNPRAELNGQWYELRDLGTEGQGLTAYPNKNFYSLYELAIPFGGGLKFKVSESINFITELGWRYTFTDYLDDVSSTYPDYYILLENRGAIAANLSNRTAEALGQTEPFIYNEGSSRGNADVKDYYFIFNIGFSYNLTDSYSNSSSIRSYRKKSSTSKCPRF